MGIAEILIVVACSVFVLFVIIKTKIDKKKGKCSCGGDCSSCSLCKKDEE